MRLRKKPWKETVLQQASDLGLLITQPEDFKGQWRSINNFSQVVVEIGAGKGDYWINLAKDDPSTLVIAIERMTDVAVIALKKAIESEVLVNHRLLISNGDRLEEFFEPSEITRIHLNFSDPWPKNHQKKRRLTHPTRLEKYHQLLKEDGEILLKTDNQDFYLDTLEYFENDAWQLMERNDDFRNQVQNDPITEYEQRFMDLNQPIYHAIWRRKNV